MSVWAWVAVAWGLFYWSMTCVTAGYLFGKEPLGEKGPRWWGSLVLAGLGWPLVLTLWRSSRLAPPQPWRPGVTRIVDMNTKKSEEGS